MKKNEAWQDWMHDWQKAGFNGVVKVCNRSTEHQPIMVNACVGSGKTALAALAFADFVDLHKDERTIQMFVTPRIKLCAQQSHELADNIKKSAPFAYQQFADFSAANPSDFQIIPVDCTRHEWARNNDNLTAKHVIFIVCEASLWGTDKNDANKRWNAWKGRFDAWQKAGFVFGNVIFDEAHNYGRNEKVEMMFGQTVFTKKAGIDYAGKRCLISWFHNVMLLSGTPAWYQKDLSKAFPKNVCSCSIRTAVENEWVERPILNLVRIGFENEQKIYSNAIIQVLKHERKTIRPVNGVRLLVNFGGIDEIGYFLQDDYVKKHVGEDFHFITIHSNKTFRAEDGLSGTELTSQVDLKPYTCGTVYDLLEAIDGGCSDDEEVQKLLAKVLDGRPIVVGQVAMIGEGINIKSFSSVITKTNSDTTAMQQIGRVLRKFPGKAYPNVYCVYDNVDGLKELLSNLMIEHDLTNECFKWGDKIDVPTGSSNSDDDDDDEVNDMAKPGWMKIDEAIDADIVEVQYSEQFEHKKLSKTITLFSEQDIFMKLCKQMQSKFDKETLQRISWKMRSNDSSAKTLTKAVSKSKKKATANAKEETEENLGPVTENKINGSNEAERKAKDFSVATAKSNSDKTTEADAESNETKEKATIEDCARTVIEITKTTKLFINRHKKDAHIIDLAKADLEALTDYLFSYQPVLAEAIKESGICNNEIFCDFVFGGC